jgi:uncharacterized protein (TIGR03435 family)
MGDSGSVGVFIRGNTLQAEHADLYDLVEFAYGLTEEDQLSGGPPWAHATGYRQDATLFQVIAKAEGDTPPSKEQFRLLLQTLLADRFQLKIHHVAKSLPVFHLVVTKNGPRFKQSAPEAPFKMEVKSGAVTQITATHATIAMLALQVAHQAGRPVIDKTLLTGFYDFEIEWPEGDASLFAALQQQLGIKLEPATAPLDTLVIDHAEKPSGN